MQSARTLTLTTRPGTLRRAAMNKERVRVRGTVVDRGMGYSGSHTNTWLRIQTTAADVRVTATHTSPLGTATVGTKVELACDLTGLLDVAENLYFAKHAQLLNRS